jgi:hypothetical protein
MKLVVLFTLKAEELLVDDNLSSLLHYATPANKIHLPMRIVEFAKDLLNVEPADRQMRVILARARKRGEYTHQLVFVCDPAVEAIINEPYRKENIRLQNAAARGVRILQQVDKWDALPWWRKLACHAQGVGFRRFVGL